MQIGQILVRTVDRASLCSSLCSSRGHESPARIVGVALLVGSGVFWGKITLNYVVPYLVPSYSAANVGGLRY